MSNRPRQRRTRFISGSNLEHPNANDDNSTHRGKRGHNHCVQRHSKCSSEQHTSLPSSPNSPLLDSANLLFRSADITLSDFVSQKEIPVDRSDTVEDENSFVSSVFSEKLVQPELHLETEPSSANKNESAKELLDTDSNNSIHSKNNIDGLLMQDERMSLTPNAANTDDAGSSEGEDESETREPNLLRASSSICLENERSKKNLVSMVPPDCKTLENLYPNSSDVSVFDSRSMTTCDSTKIYSSSGSHLKSIDWHLPVTIFHSTTLSEKKHDYYASSGYMATTPASSTNSSTTGSVVTQNSVSLSQDDFRPLLNLVDFSSENSYNLSSTNTEPIQSISQSHHSLTTANSNSTIEPSELSTNLDGNSAVTNKLHKVSATNESSKKHNLTTENCNNSVIERHTYPLRSRLRQEFKRMKWRAMQLAPKSFSQLPTEVVFRIIHYLSIQDVFRLQRVNNRFKSIIEQYLLLVKRINFSNGLPFAFLPESITDVALKRMLSRTPKVTHILGFYPRKIVESYPADNPYSTNSNINSHNALTYDGIIAAFRLCPKLRSVELMDVELMSELVRYFPRIKFHGMFRNRPDSWDCEYAVPLPPESGNKIDLDGKDPRACSSVNNKQGDQSFDYRSTKPLFGSYISTLFCSVTAATAATNNRPKHRLPTRFSNYNASQSSSDNSKLNTTQSMHIPFSLASLSNSKTDASNSFTQMAAVFAHKFALKCAHLANWFEPLGELPLGQGTPSTVPHFLPSRLFTAFNGSSNFASFHDNIDMNSIPSILQDYNANALESLRNMAIAHFLQPGLPSIEAELIAVAPFGYSRRMLGSDRGIVRNNHNPVLAFAFGAIFVPPHIAPPYIPPPAPSVPNNSANYRIVDARQYNSALSGAHLIRGAHAGQYQFAFERAFINAPQNGANLANAIRQPQPLDAVPARNQSRSHNYSPSNQSDVNGPWLVSPLPCHMQWIILPHAITNLTKLDLVSVAISAIPRLDNIKYLHLKWVVFASNDPFFNFAAPKLQSFVMNNCSIPSRVVRFVRIFSALSRAPQLMRLEMVGTRFIDGLIVHIVDDTMSPGRGFRNLQRLVLSNNKDASELDIGLLLLVAQQSLNQVSLQMLHTKNSLFEALYHSGAKFLRLESLVLGYLDPYQSRLTVSELMSLGIGESSDHLNPVCTITDWGLAFVFQLCPRLVNLTIRNAPYLLDLAHWFTPPQSQVVTEEAGAGADNVVPESNSNCDVSNPHAPPQSEENAECCILSCQINGGFSSAHFTSLRSLTLENCPAISVENLERVLSTGLPFPCLETLVLRNLFAPRYGTCSKNYQSNSIPTMTSDGCHIDNTDWRRLSHLLTLSDFLAARRLGYSSLSPEGVGLSCSAREVTHANPPRSAFADILRTKSFDFFYCMRMHTYLNRLMELDGSLSRPSNRVYKTLFADVVPISSQPRQSVSTEKCTEFVSQSTQTCVCGLLEWDLMLRMCHMSPTNDTNSNSYNTSCSVPNVATSSVINESSDSSNSGRYAFSRSVWNWHMSSHGQPQLQLGGPLAFHPFPPTVQHMMLCKLVISSEWTRLFSRGHMALNLPPGSIAHALSTGECPGCASDPGQLLYRSSYTSVSALRQESSITHRRRKWVARDACLDTSELRCYALISPQILSINQPLDAPFSNLTSLHFEKVGISHLIIIEARHLKNITLENCTELRALLFKPTNVNIDAFPALRRIRIINCPKFAIYNFLHSVSGLYPLHDENLSITYRPFGKYDCQVERALWNYCQHAHILISHDYKIETSERVMEEFHSTFDQLFREVNNFADMLIRRDLLTVHPQPNEFLQNPFYRRSEHGMGWDFVTDNPWIHEVCCSLLRNGELHRSDQVDQFYELLSEFQSMPKQLKIQRHGIHFHVQYRNVHSSCINNTALNVNDSGDFPVKHTHSYLNWPYTETFILSNTPSTDPNAWLHALPECSVTAESLCEPVSHLGNNLSTWQRLLLSQEEELCTGLLTHNTNRHKRKSSTELSKQFTFEQKHPRLCTQRSISYFPKATGLTKRCKTLLCTSKRKIPESLEMKQDIQSLDSHVVVVQKRNSLHIGEFSKPKRARHKN